MAVYFEPKKAFADIAARPGWIVPVILLIIIGIVGTSLIGSRIGWERAMRPMLENNKRMQQLEPAQRDAAIQQQIKFGPIFGYVAAVAYTPIKILLVAAVLLLMIKMAGASLKYKQMFAITAYASLPNLVAGILFIVVLFLKNPDEFNLQNPLAFNVAAFMEPPPATGRFLYSLGTSLDLFTIWIILLLAVGISAASRKVGFSKALMLVLTPWVIWVLVTSGLAGAFS